MKEDNQSGKNITNNMVAENIVSYLTQPTKTALNPAEAGVQTNETSEQKEQDRSPRKLRSNMSRWICLKISF